MIQRKIRLLDAEVHYEYCKKEGEKESCYTLVLIHGFLASSFSFRKLIPFLKGKYDIYTIDLVGFGESEKTASFKYSYRNYASLVLEFTKQLGLKNVILIGHSMGGQISLYTALIAPNKIKGLVLIACSGYLKKSNSWAVLLSKFPFSRSFIRLWIKKHKVLDVLRTTLYDTACIDEEMIRAYSKPIEDKNFCHTLLGLLRDREGDLETKDLHKITHPVLLLWGDEDQIIPLKTGVHLRQDLPNSTLVSIPEAGHQVMEEKPEQVYAAFQQWLATTDF
ncbi:alpha/beta fold hydrolase [Ammoniphilus resinae]|uniref:Pimeloyl-ACP methyl ester carboxylesterase n=1 Tax=Ammoniphilus resinae TaxID=861532 RepID=A0ABS4GJU9_9BACL|nr:alpha/beta hydrolase [Ammoniphilus resinae]MBP1930548.1 pimeloyl-ACP methyl ester carboxylesterase [Ammoniphilus resinae]